MSSRHTAAPNAALIAAAPEMYKALEEIADLVDGRVDIDNEGGPNLAMQIQSIVLAALQQAKPKRSKS